MKTIVLLVLIFVLFISTADLSSETLAQKEAQNQIDESITFLVNQEKLFANRNPELKTAFLFELFETTYKIFEFGSRNKHRARALELEKILTSILPQMSRLEQRAFNEYFPLTNPRKKTALDIYMTTTGGLMKYIENLHFGSSTRSDDRCTIESFTHYYRNSLWRNCIFSTRLLYDDKTPRSTSAMHSLLRSHKLLLQHKIEYLQCQKSRQ